MYTKLFAFRNKTYKHRIVRNDKPTMPTIINQHLLTKQPKDHVWVYDLKCLDSMCMDYSLQSLVIVRGSTKKELKFKSWKQIQQLPNDQVNQLISEVIIIPRSAHGQYYIVNGLCSSLHFSLGSSGKDAFVTFLRHRRIKINLNNQSSVLFVKTAKQYLKTRVEHHYFKLMVSMGSQLWHALFEVSS